MQPWRLTGIVVDDAPRVEEMRRARRSSTTASTAPRVHARARDDFVRRIGVELRPVDAVLARAAAASERRARRDDGVAVAVARREEHGDAAPEERVGDGRRRRRDVRRDQRRKLAPEVARQPRLEGPLRLRWRRVSTQPSALRRGAYSCPRRRRRRRSPRRSRRAARRPFADARQAPHVARPARDVAAELDAQTSAAPTRYLAFCRGNDTWPSLNVDSTSSGRA